MQHYVNGELLDMTAEEVAAFLGPVDTRKATMRQALAAERWRRTQTFTYDGVDGAPADSAMVAVTGVVVADTVAPLLGSITWKLADGEFRDWTVEDVAAYGLAIRAHVQDCFDREAALDAEISAAEDHAALDLIDLSAGWPT